MAQLAAFNLKAWIDRHRHLLKPPVGNALVFRDTDFQVMIVGGPNSRNDYHIDPYEELFYQLEGDIAVRVMEEGGPRDIAIRAGEMFLLPPHVPHSPQRGPDTIGMVIERARSEGDLDRFRWYCGTCSAVLHETALHVSDLVTQLKPVLEAVARDAALRTCRRCGAVTPPPAPAAAG
jgi:3-hydroxyanthranilate 3,4-dioxygenase